MTATPPLVPRKPEHPPTPADLAERDRFAALAEASLPSIRASAEAWRNGLAAFVTLVTTGAVIKGRDTTAHLTTGWRVAVTAAIGGGIALSLAGLWLALAAQAGTDEGAVALEQIHSSHASVAAYQAALANTAARRLRRARATVAAALCAFLVGIVATWWAPEARSDTPAKVTVLHDGTSTCGTLESADGGAIRVRVAGAHDSVTVPLAKVTNILIVGICDK